MDIKYLAIERDLTLHERESAFWKSRNISSIHVSAMCEGIKAAAREQFLYIGINANNIKNYMPMLKLLRGVTHAPIFVSTTTFTAQEQAEAVNNGADLFAPIGENPSRNYDSVMACINRLNERAKQPKPDVELVTYKDILIVPSHHRAFIMDEEMRLTKNEMDILYHLTVNRGKILSHEQLYERLTNTHENHQLSVDNIYTTVKRLRKKIREVSQTDYIETVRDVGYRLAV